MTRRIITGNNAEGKSYIAADETVSDMYVWQSIAGDPMGASPDGAPTRLLPSTAPHIEPPAGGSKCARVEIQPWKVMKPILEKGIPGLDANGFHRTATVDYIMVVSGEVKLLLDEGDTIVRAGDLVVQRNTNHAWHNLGDGPADLWGVMVSMLPAL
jgi:mannose-6-phosphate isomerase-like protein (cupin superfamily)